MKLDPAEIEAARAHLTPQDALPLIRFMAEHSMDGPADPVPDDIVQTARDLGWIDPQTGARTEIGFPISDSCREYLFWKDRNEALPFEGALPHLERDTFRGKYVAEIGAGMGANLMSLEGTADRLCGVEPVEVYVQLGRVFRAREGRDEIDIRIGTAEALPFGDGTFDLVLCVTAHQYFDIRRALSEIARVIRPGGELIIIGATLSAYGIGGAREVVRAGGRGAKSYAMTMINTLSYQVAGRRLLSNRSRPSTARPIYPGMRAMMRWLDAAGFDRAARPQPAAGECCFYVRRRDDRN